MQFDTDNTFEPMAAAGKESICAERAPSSVSKQGWASAGAGLLLAALVVAPMDPHPRLLGARYRVTAWNADGVPSLPSAAR